MIRPNFTLAVTHSFQLTASLLILVHHISLPLKHCNHISPLLLSLPFFFSSCTHSTHSSPLLQSSHLTIPLLHFLTLISVHCLFLSYIIISAHQSPLLHIHTLPKSQYFSAFEVPTLCYATRLGSKQEKNKTKKEEGKYCLPATTVPSLIKNP